MWVEVVVWWRRVGIWGRRRSGCRLPSVTLDGKANQKAKRQCQSGWRTGHKTRHTTHTAPYTAHSAQLKNYGSKTSVVPGGVGGAATLREPSSDK